ncbi:MAG: DNA repair protein RadA, partial [Spirochaetia bacterium]|nr:DNA repair protein RadA [Spirochaetia bacterium]
GGIRPVPQCGRRAQEFKASGFSKIVCSEGDVPDIRSSGFTGEIAGVGTIAQAMEAVFGTS